MAGHELRVTEGKERGKRLSIEGDLLIGRAAEDREGRLGGDPEISRRHARVSRAGGGELTIEDLGSANGTFVNGRRIDRRLELAPGDVVRIGKTVLEVTAAARPRAAEPPRPPAEPPVELVISDGPDAGRRLALDGELVLGRGVEGDGKLGGDRQLSRRHARLTRDPSGRLVLEDLGSANGTFVNGERVHGRRVLEPGDSIRVGSTTLELVAPGAAQARPPAAAPPPPRAARRPARAQPPPEPRPLASDLPLGSVFAGCRVDEVIGHGDMGIVYSAEELALQRRLALKLIRPEFSRDERFRERFRRESRIAAAIDHPHVIPVFDAGEENGILYLTMRLVEGTDLRALIAARGPLEPLRAARIVRDVGAALDAAHARGMLHRDVKPSNVLLARENHVYLTDFGLAKPAASGDGLTRHGTVVARAEYVAPEQLMNEPVDARADVYALGCLLFEALTGEPPFGRPGAPLPSPSELAPAVPREFDDVIGQAMAKDPEERYPSGGDLGEAALVAAGGLRRAKAWSMVATGDASFVFDVRRSASRERPVVAAPDESAPEAPVTVTNDPVRWAIAIVALLLVGVGMVAALHGISTLK
jgi:pSer/pThr/pTyr-binding forkhead associated (FHA) protein